jgi:hypothetical protein
LAHHSPLWVSLVFVMPARHPSVGWAAYSAYV